MPEVSLELLQTLLQRTLDEVVGMRSESREFRQRIGLLERQVASLTGNEAEHYASLSFRMDDVVSRLDRIERRLELVDVPSK